VNIESLLIEQSSVIALYRVGQQGEHQVTLRTLVR